MKKIIFVAALLSVFGLVSCKKESSKNELFLYNWTYYTPDEVIHDFEKEFNCTVKVDSYASNEEMYAKLRAGAKGYDIVVPSQDYVSIMISQGMLQELNQEKMTNKVHLNPKCIEKMDFDPELKYCLPYYLGAAGVSVNKNKVTDASYERTWNIFADPQFKGHATMMDDMREVMGDALATLGFDVNTLNDEELKQAAALIEKNWKPNIVKFDAEAFGKSFATGDFWLCQGYAEVVFGEVPEENWDTIDFFIPKAGGPAYLDSMCILKDAKHADLANEFINYIHRPEVYAKFLDAFHFPCFVNNDAAQFVTTKPMYEASMMDSCTLKNDLGEGLDKYNNLWQEIRFN